MEVLYETPVSEILKGFSTQNPKYSENEIIDSIEKLLLYTPLPSERGKKEKVIKHLVEEWFSKKMRKKYEELSPEIFQLKTKIEIEGKHFKNDYYSLKNETVSLEIPALLHAEINKDREWEKKFKYKREYDEYEFTLSSEMPRIPLDVKKAGKEALAYAYKTFGDALTTEVLDDVIIQNPEDAPHPEDAKLLVAWKPKPSELKIKIQKINRDPALILNYGRPYLVGMWMEPEKESFMELISIFQNYSTEEIQ